MAKYAEHTKVTIQASQAEIIAHLARHGVTQYGNATTEHGNCVWFRYGGISFELSIYNDPNDDERERQRKWRSLALGVKAKLVMATDGITTIEKEFMSFIMTPDGQLFGDRYLPEIRESAKALNGKVTLSLPAPREKA